MKIGPVIWAVKKNLGREIDIVMAPQVALHFAKVKTYKLYSAHVKLDVNGMGIWFQFHMSIEPTDMGSRDMWGEKPGFKKLPVGESNFQAHSPFW